MQNKDQNNFFEKVYAVVLQIPYGKVTTYGHIAEKLGSRGSARMVGWAMNACHSAAIAIPAHRVVNRNGMLTGKMHFPHPDYMQQMLETEGIKVKNDKIVHFTNHLWIPNSDYS